MKAVHIISWIARIALIATMVLCLLFWITQISFIGIHMLLGLTGVLSLLVLGTMAASTRGIRLLGAESMAYALMVPAFGLTQYMILVGNLHWLIQTAHLLVGIGAMALAQVIEKRYRHLKNAASGGGFPPDNERRFKPHDNMATRSSGAVKEHPPPGSNGRFGAGPLAPQFDATDQAGAGQARGQKACIGRLGYGPKGNHMSQEKTDATSALATPGGTLRARGTHRETDTER